MLFQNRFEQWKGHRSVYCYKYYRLHTHITSETVVSQCRRASKKLFKQIEQKEVAYLKRTRLETGTSSKYYKNTLFLHKHREKCKLIIIAYIFSLFRCNYLIRDVLSRRHIQNSYDR